MAPLCKQSIYKSTGVRSNFLSLNLKLNHVRATPLDQLVFIIVDTFLGSCSLTIN